MRIAIVDDEALARERLARLCRVHPDVEIAAIFGDAATAAAALPSLSADLVFLDIRMPQHDGFDLASALAATSSEVVFVTAYDEYAVRAFAAGAVDYLLKPVDSAGIARALERIRIRIRTRIGTRISPEIGTGTATGTATTSPPPTPPPSTPARIAVRDGDRFIFVMTADIEVITAAGNYVELRAGGKCYSLRATLASMAARLDPRAFVRVHRSAFVRVERIASIEPLFRGEYLVTLADGTTLTSSRSQRTALRGALGLPP